MKKLSNKKKGQIYEEFFIKTLNSGAVFGNADAVSKNNALEIKYTEGKGFRITTKQLKKLWEQACNNGKFPLFGIGIKDDKDLWMLKIEIARKRI